MASKNLSTASILVRVTGLVGCSWVKLLTVLLLLLNPLRSPPFLLLPEISQDMECLGKVELLEWVRSLVQVRKD